MSSCAKYHTTKRKLLCAAILLPVNDLHAFTFVPLCSWMHVYVGNYLAITSRCDGLISLSSFSFLFLYLFLSPPEGIITTPRLENLPTRTQRSKRRLRQRSLRRALWCLGRGGAWCGLVQESNSISTQPVKTQNDESIRIELLLLLLLLLDHADTVPPLKGRAGDA